MLDADDWESVELALEALPTWFPQTLEKVRAIRARSEMWQCPWPDEYPDGCPYCSGEVCARFDGLGCTHDERERHGYPEADVGERRLRERLRTIREACQRGESADEVIRLVDDALFGRHGA